MKKTTYYLNPWKGLFSGFFMLATFGACTSEYHWVKAKSENVSLINKSDGNFIKPVNPSAEEAKLVTQNVSEKASLPGKTLIAGRISPTAHGEASLSKSLVNQKAEEISKSLTAQRLVDLNSTNLEVRTQAVKQTLHEQFLKNPSYAKLSSKKQDKLESKISAKIAKSSSAQGDQLFGVNKLIVYGLAIVLIGVLFLFILSPLGFVIEALGGIIFIIGLIQQFS